jgi:hypothetical protein
MSRSRSADKSSKEKKHFSIYSRDRDRSRKCVNFWNLAPMFSPTVMRVTVWEDGRVGPLQARASVCQTLGGLGA